MNSVYWMDALRNVLQVPFFDIGFIYMFDATLAPKLPEARRIARKWISRVLYTPLPVPTDPCMTGAIHSAAVLSCMLDALQRHPQIGSLSFKDSRYVYGKDERKVVTTLCEFRSRRANEVSEMPGALIYLQCVPAYLTSFHAVEVSTVAAFSLRRNTRSISLCGRI